MKFESINAIYSQKVAALIAEGYTINTATMGGSQGDIAAIDLRRGTDVLRVRLHKEMAYTWKDENFWGDNITLTVGRCTDEQVIKATGLNTYMTIWNNRLETVEERVFWIMGRDEAWFIEGDEGKAALRKSNSRYGNREEHHERLAFPGMEKTMLPAIRRRLGKDRFPVSKVEEIYKAWSSSEGKYCYYASIGNCRAVKFC